jgi:type IV fimbrial biogenesis protein FimT
MDSTRKQPTRGFTLIELMVTIALLVIVIAIGVPSFQAAINGSRLTAATNELSAGVQLARAESIKRNRVVVLCRSEDMLSCADGDTWNGWLVFADTNADGVVDVGEDIIKTGTIDAPLVVRASPGISSRAMTISFLPNGMARGADEMALLNASLSLCTPFAEPATNVRDLLIAFGGRASVRSRGTAGVCSAAPSDT